MSHRAVEALLQLREQHRFMKGLFAWIGFRQTELVYRRAQSWLRLSGQISVNDKWRPAGFAVSAA